MPGNKRRHYFIDNDFQGRYLFKAFIAVTIGSVLFALIFSFFSSNTLSIVYENYHLRLGTTPGLLLNRIVSAQWLFILLGGGAVVLIALFLSHRVAGPFYRFEQTLAQMIFKDLSIRIQLRKNDEGKKLGEKINNFNEMLSINLEQLIQGSEKIRQCCEKPPQGVDKAQWEDLLLSRLEEIRRLNQDNQQLLGKFRLR